MAQRDSWPLTSSIDRLTTSLDEFVRRLDARLDLTGSSAAPRTRSSGPADAAAVGTAGRPGSMTAERPARGAEFLSPRQLAQAIQSSIQPLSPERREADRLAREQVEALRKIDRNTEALRKLEALVTFS